MRALAWPAACARQHRHAHTPRQSSSPPAGLQTLRAPTRSVHAALSSTSAAPAHAVCSSNAHLPFSPPPPPPPCAHPPGPCMLPAAPPAAAPRQAAAGTDGSGAARGEGARRYHVGYVVQAGCGAVQPGLMLRGAANSGCAKPGKRAVCRRAVWDQEWRAESYAVASGRLPAAESQLTQLFVRRVEWQLASQVTVPLSQGGVSTRRHLAIRTRKLHTVSVTN